MGLFNYIAKNVAKNMFGDGGEEKAINLAKNALGNGNKGKNKSNIKKASISPFVEEGKLKENQSEPKSINYDNLNESYNNSNSTFEGLKKYYQGEKGMSDDEFAKLIKNSDWSKGKKATEWLNKYNSNNGVDNNMNNDKESEPSKKTLDDLKANEKDVQYRDAVSDAKLVSDVADTQKKDGKDYDDTSEIVKIFNKEASNIDDYYKENLPTSIWRMYKNGEFDGTSGDEKKDRQEGRERLGYLLLNQLGTNLVNASLIARGSAPSAESDLQKLRRTKLEGALDRYNAKRNETMSKTIEQLGLNAELLNKFNLDLDTLKNNKIFEEVSKSLDRKGMERTMKAYKLAGDYLDGLNEDQIRNVGKAIMALNTKDAKDAGIFYLTNTVGDEAVNKLKKLFGL